jgi:cobalt-precorrin 5A hydrolase
MAVGKAMIIAGIGCRRGAPANDIEAVIRAAFARAGMGPNTLGAIATIATKQGEAGIETAAAHFGVKLVFVGETELKAASQRTETKSERVLAIVGAPSVAEAAALAAAGPSSRLIGNRLVIGSATCALATSEAAA